MRKRSAAIGLRHFRVMAAILALACGVFGQNSKPFSLNESPLPAPTGFVNDYAGVLDPATKQQLESKLRNFKETSSPSVELAVAIVKTTGDRPISDYSLAVARGWKIGSKADDNPSALLFIAIDDRKYFTQVSKDLEDELPDGVVGSLQRQYLVPEFRNCNYGKGISDTLDAYMSTIRNKGNAPVSANTNRPRPAPSSGGSAGSLGTLFCCGIIILVILLIIFTRRRGGGGGGGLAGNIASGVIGGLIGNAIGGGSSSSWGGSSGGSDWAGSSGGFGGFGGGGDFGGGGAGGDW